MKHHELYGEKVDFSKWSLEAVDNGLDELKPTLQQVILKAIGEVLELAIKDGGNAYFPIEWSFSEKNSDGYNGERVDDPNIIYFGFPFCAGEFEYVHFKADLREMIKWLIEGYEIGDGGPITGEKERDILAKVSGALKDCAGKLDEALKRDVNPQNSLQSHVDEA